MTKSQNMRQLKDTCLACRKCPIGGQQVDGCISNVFSNMCLKARIMVIGQNPGMTETKLGRPFVGPSGDFFDKVIMEVLGVDRSKFYITNIVKCWKLGNAAPTDEEVKTCRHILDAEIGIIKPELIITLGNPAMKCLTWNDGIKNHHGQLTTAWRYAIPVLPLYHPSPYNTHRADLCDMFKQDIAQVRKWLT